MAHAYLAITDITDNAIDERAIQRSRDGNSHGSGASNCVMKLQANRLA